MHSDAVTTNSYDKSNYHKLLMASAKAMWEALKALYENKSASNQANLLIKLLTTKMGDSDTIETHFASLDGIIMDLRAAGFEGH